MESAVTFTLKDDGSQEINVQPADVAEIVPDADFRFCLLIMKNGDKHFVAGTRQDIEGKLGWSQTELEAR